MGGVAWMAALLLLRLEWAVGRGKGWRRWLGLCRKCKRRGVGRERRGRAMRCGERGWMWQGVRGVGAGGVELARGAVAVGVGGSQAAARAAAEEVAGECVWDRERLVVFDGVMKVAGEWWWEIG